MLYSQLRNEKLSQYTDTMMLTERLCHYSNATCMIEYCVLIRTNHWSCWS